MSSFSQMPDDILQRISCFMGVKDACNMSRASKQTYAALGQVQALRMRFEFETFLRANLKGTQAVTPSVVFGIFEAFLWDKYYMAMAGYEAWGNGHAMNDMRACVVEADLEYKSLSAAFKSGKNVAADYKALMEKFRLDLCFMGGRIVREGSLLQEQQQTKKEGEASLKKAVSTVPTPSKILGDRVLHFTTAKDAIIESDKLRISATSDQGCVFCVPARYANDISTLPPSDVKQVFDIRQDLSYYIEFNLEQSSSYESSNKHIDAKVCKGQKELKVKHEILQLSLRDAKWYEWKGKSKGGWVLVPGPYNWGKKK